MSKIVYGNDTIGQNFEVYTFGNVVFHEEILPHVDACIWKSEDQFGFSIYLDNAPDNDETQRAVNLMHMVIESIQAVDGFDVSGFAFNSGNYSYGFMMMCGNMNEYNDLFHVITTIHADSEVHQYKVDDFHDYLSDKCDKLNDLMDEEPSD